jgi:hypothetical protein
MDLGQLTTSIKFLLRDRAGQLTDSFDAVFHAEGIRILASPPQAPRANAICEPMIGTLRREVSGRMLIVNEHHLRQVLTEYLRHYNTARPHRALGQLAPAQADTRPPQINLAEHRIRRKQILADSYTNTRSPPDSPRLPGEDAGHHPDRVFEPNRTCLTRTSNSATPSTAPSSAACPRSFAAWGFQPPCRDTRLDGVPVRETAGIQPVGAA